MRITSFDPPSEMRAVPAMSSTPPPGDGGAGGPSDEVAQAPAATGPYVFDAAPGGEALERAFAAEDDPPRDVSIDRPHAPALARGLAPAARGGFDRPPALRRPCDRVPELFDRWRLHEVNVEPGVLGATLVLGERVARQRDQERSTERQVAPQCLRHRVPAHPRKPDVAQHDVGAEHAALLEPFTDPPRRAVSGATVTPASTPRAASASGTRPSWIRWGTPGEVRRKRLHARGVVHRDRGWRASSPAANRDA